jgi:hypothetical protein
MMAAAVVLLALVVRVWMWVRAREGHLGYFKLSGADISWR